MTGLAKSGKRLRFRAFRIDELSGVDKPAQEGAVQSIIKRAPGDDRPSLRKGRSAPIMTSVEDGHTHLIWLWADDAGGYASMQYAPDADHPHDHPWVMKNGSIVVGEDSGHTHEVPMESFNAAVMAIAMGDVQKGRFCDPLFEELPIWTEDDIPAAVVECQKADGEVREALELFICKCADELGVERPDVGESVVGQVPGKDGQVSKPTTKAATTAASAPKTSADDKLDALQKRVEAAEARALKAEAITKLAPTHREHFEGLAESERDAFLKLDEPGRDAIVKNAADADPIIYTLSDGTTFRKSEEKYANIAKRLEEQEKVAKAAQEQATVARLEKRAADELGNLTGSPIAKVALLRVIDGIGDESLRKDVAAIVKAANEIHSGLFKNRGFGATEKSDTDDVDAYSQLEKIADGYMQKDGELDRETALELARQDRPDLFQKSVMGL